MNSPWPARTRPKPRRKPGRFADEIVGVTVKTRKGDVVVNSDEYIRHGATLDAWPSCAPPSPRTARSRRATPAGLNDGAAATLLMSADEAERRGIEPLARIASYATAGLDPSIMGVGPIYASRKALEKAGWSVGDLDLVEANEAFAAQACAVNKDMGWDPAIVNVNGGAIAIGHPIGASGCRVLNTLLFEMKRRDAQAGLATLVHRRRHGRRALRRTPLRYRDKGAFGRPFSSRRALNKLCCVLAALRVTPLPKTDARLEESWQE
jgi:acetyl-CoA C-acetyltransferase